MKKTFNYLTIFSFIAVLIFITSSEVQAQAFDIKDGTVDHNDNKRPCLVVSLDPEPKPLKKAWKSFLKDNYDFKIRGIGFLVNKDLLSAKDLIIEEISAKRMDFYTKIVEDEVGSEMKVFASFGYDIYIDKKNMQEEYKAMNNMLKSFLKSYLPKYYKSEVKATKKKIKSLNKDVKGLTKDISNSKEEIQDLTKKIKELTSEVAEKEAMLSEADIKLKERQEKLQRISRLSESN